MSRRMQPACPRCQQIDDHPRHAFGVAAGQPLPVPWHMDCHVIATECELCAEQLVKCDTDPSNDGVKGAELAQRLITLRAQHQEG